MVLYYSVSGFADVGILALRIAVGGLIFLHGYPKFKTQKQTAEFVKSMGIPIPKISALYSAFVEAIGGIAIFFGILTQIFAVLLAINMLFALYIQVIKFKSPITGGGGKSGYELDLLYLFGAIALIFLGGGAFSIDALINV